MIQELTGVIRSEAVQRAIIGLPLNMDGTAGLAAERSRQLAAALTAELKRQGISCEILLWDERLTSYEAEMRLRERGIAKGKAKDILDSLAAEVLLEDYLAHHRADLPDDPETKEPS
jgi:putative Holliday junction resolvase